LATPDVIAGWFQYRPVADRRQLELHGTRAAARRSNTVVTEPQRQRLPIHIEYRGLPSSASASPSSSVSVTNNG
jgi:hypothetical protein